MARLTDNTVLVHPDTGATVQLATGGDVPSWASDIVGDHLVEGLASSDVPPKGGPGSGKDAWVAYAAAHDVEVPGDASRDDIVAALNAAGIPTE